MKKKICSALVIMATLLMFSGCSSTKAPQMSENQTEAEILVNEAFDKEQMVTLNGGEYLVANYDKTYTAKNLGFGITLSDTMIELRDEGRLSVNEFENWVTVDYISDEALKLMENTDFENLSQEEALSLFETYSAKVYPIVGVYCHNQKDPVSKKEQDAFASTFRHVDELIVVDQNAYYLGYHTDYAHMNLNEAEQKVMNELLEEIESFKNGIAIFPVVQEEVFEGNMKEFSTVDLNQTAMTQDIFKDYDITMVNIWATWCGPCVSEMPELQKLYTQLPKNVNMISLCVDGKEDAQAAEEIIDAAGVKFHVLVPDDKLQKSLLDEVQYFPTTIFVDKDGMPVGEAIFGVPSHDNIAGSYLSAIEERVAQQGE